MDASSESLLVLPELVIQERTEAGGIRIVYCGITIVCEAPLVLAQIDNDQKIVYLHSAELK